MRTLAAQRALLRRPADVATTAALFALSSDREQALEARVAALFAIALGPPRCLRPIALRPTGTEPYVLRALGDMRADAGEMITAGLKSANPQSRLEALVAATRRGLTPLAEAMATTLGDSDPVVAHTAFRALAMLGVSDACFAILDTSSSTPAERLGATRALMRMHQPAVVDGIIARLQSEKRPDVRQLLLSALCRLGNVEGEWDGASWGAWPDTRGPYYQPEAWGETPKIASALAALLANAEAGEAAFLIKEMDRNRIESDDALAKIIELASADAALAPDAIAQMAATGFAPPAGIPILLEAARATETSPATLAQAITVLSKTDSPLALDGMFAALTNLEKTDGSGKYREAGVKEFLNAPKLENHHLALELFATENPESPAALSADAGLIALASRKSGSPESRQMSQKAIDAAWASPGRRASLIAAAARSASHALDARILSALGDGDDRVAAAAGRAAKVLKLDPDKRDTTPKISTLEPAAALAAVIRTRGDFGLGEQLFTRATCVACHTVSQDEPQRRHLPRQYRSDLQAPGPCYQHPRAKPIDRSGLR